MDIAGHVVLEAAHIYARNDTTSSGSTTVERPAAYKTVGIILAVCSGLFIGVSFVLKKVGLLKANVKYNEEAGEGYGYLKNAYWWTGMTLMILGEICNFVAYAFVDAILVTPLGALSVVVTTILSAIFLKERLSFVGKVSCFLCIIGSVVIVLNAPAQSAVADIQQMQSYVIAPGFLSYAGIIIVGCAIVAIWVAPKYGKKSMLVYLTICSLIGGLSVVATQGLGSAIIAQINGKQQFNQWFLYVLFVFVIATLLTEIIFLNKALNLFNAAMVTPTYYVYFTSATIVTSAVLFQGFKGTAVSITTVVMGFLVICSGVVLLQLAKSSKDVPDAAIFKGDLDQVRIIAQQEEPEYEPRADTVRGGAAIVRAMSRARTIRQVQEAHRIHDERMEPIGENEQVEWDGLRRRRTISNASGSVHIKRKPVHPPLGMSHFPDDVSEPDSEVHPGFFGRIGRKNTFSTSHSRRSGRSPVPLETVAPDDKRESTATAAERGQIYGMYRHSDLPTDGSHDIDTAYKSTTSGKHLQWAGDVAENERDHTSSRGSSLVPPRVPPHGQTTGQTAKRAFSFTNVFHRHRSDASNEGARPTSRGQHSFMSRQSDHHDVTEEERLGLVQGDSSKRLPKYDEVPNEEESDDWQLSTSPERLPSRDDIGKTRGRDPYDDYDDESDDPDIGKPRVPGGLDDK
ncbi:hypothetical protein AMS68_004397 [Peltaster fructicola]|uniref:Uncharacterized protein n=1 Tax=Peltaster fructicola TaxID=286661 RepID=A0A6H0XWR9_9PEZI|nr:hypothetical protein AMS68_004397 [Peltaster fructicola]